MKGDDTDDLIDDLLEGEISEADFLRLEAELIVSKNARQSYYDQLKLDTGLRVESEAASGGDGQRSVGGSATRKRKGIDWLMVAGMAALAIFLGVLGWQIGQDSQAAAAEEPVASGFGVVAAASEAHWGPGVDLEVNDLIPLGSLDLQTGLVKLELFSGAVFLVEGPAEFEVLSPMEIELTSGLARMVVPPPAGGFLLHTREGIIDHRESESLCRVSAEAVEMHVLSGKIEWIQEEETPKPLTKGESLRWLSVEKRAEAELSFNPALPGALRSFDADESNRRLDRFETWQGFGRTLRDDERLLAKFPMETGSRSVSDRQVEDVSRHAYHGARVRAEFAPDRWGNPFGSLDFSPTGSRVRVTIPGEFESLTLMCWVKIDSLDRLFNSLFLTDGHELHEPHWQLMNDGRIFFSVRAREQKGKTDKHHAFSPPIWTPTQGGQWMHLATVYDGNAFTVTHYLNGEAISIDQIPDELKPEKVVIGAASIGNWSEPVYRKDAEFAVRNLNGSIDDFTLFSAALSAAEILEIYESSAP